jgi:hypothetical protein
MEELLKIAAGAGGGGLAIVLMYAKMLAGRLDGISAKLDRMNGAITDHEVRLRVIEKEDDAT